MATLSNVSKYILLEITTFLTPAEALNFAATCKTTKDDLDLGIIEDNFSHKNLSDKRWDGSYHNGDAINTWFRFMPLFCQDRIHSIQFTADCVDQGWGNRKSKLFIFEEDESVDHQRGQLVTESHLLEHHPTPVKFEFHPKPKKNYLMCYRVGGGGGHKLFVRNPKIRLLICDSRGISRAIQIFQKKDFQQILGTNFGVDLMAGVVDSLTNSIDHNQEQHQHLVSCFSSIGVDITDSNLLNGMKSFFTEISKVRVADQRRDENV